MPGYRLASLTLALTTLPLMAACAVDSGDMDEGSLGVAEQAMCPVNMDCEPVEEPEDPQPPGPQITCANIPATGNWGYLQNATLIRYVNRYSAKQGYAAGFPNFNAAKYSGPLVYGVHLLPGSAVAEWRNVPRSALGNSALDNIGEMMRRSQDYAVANGLGAAMPTFEQGVENGQVVYGVSFLRWEAFEFRDVSACELGNPNVNDASQMFRAANAYAGAHGFAAAFPTFHTGNGGVFGVILLKPGYAEWRDVPYPDLYENCGGLAQSACNYSYDPGPWCDSTGGLWYNYDTGSCTNKVIACGGQGNVCCNRTSCSSGLECVDAGTTWSYCRVPPCGGQGQACCGGGTCNSGLQCDGGTCYVPAPTSGSDYVGMSQVSSSQWYRYENPNKASPLLGTEVKIASLENTSGYTITLRHVDKNGSSSNVALNPGDQVTYPFAGQGFSGFWGADLHNVTQAWAPGGLTVKVNWVK
ncbi:hypothetical protein [Polyangium aurulentum]|uniref:hypothetical protein n=1 Tax=Polyangium aurulentum TaxID=2567896 RepID=UPI0010AE06F3|nr:hypothetical protein [Polyangium aurulentum]UQA62781.1 hypothetical protein E8A73_020955 [Polyangium aurulentum]